MIDSRSPINALLIAACLANWPQAAAVEIRQGEQYAGGTLLESSAAGVALRVPARWQAAWPNGSELLVLRAQDGASFIFVRVDQMTDHAAAEIMSKPLPLGDGIVLHPRQAAEKTPDGLISAAYKVAGAPRPLRARISTRIGPHGVGAAFIMVGTPTSFSFVAKLGDELARSTGFRKPVAPSIPTTAGSDTGWQQYLRGRYVVRYFTATGYTEEDHIWLCSDGRFFRKGASGGFGGGASGASASNANGRWQATGRSGGVGELVLQYGPGALSQTRTTFGDWSRQSAGYNRIVFSLELRNDRLHLNGKRWLRGDNTRCR